MCIRLLIVSTIFLKSATPEVYGTVFYTKARKVLFAEAEKNSVDFLFHILSVPLGNVIKLFKVRGKNGCLPKLYESIENLNDTYMD
ncbi:hypothetical protein P3S68_013428 [Capsicum galapagoense]